METSIAVSCVVLGDISRLVPKTELCWHLTHLDTFTFVCAQEPPIMQISMPCWKTTGSPHFSGLSYIRNFLWLNQVESPKVHWHILTRVHLFRHIRLVSAFIVLQHVMVMSITFQVVQSPSGWTNLQEHHVFVGEHHGFWLRFSLNNWRTNPWIFPEIISNAWQFLVNHHSFSLWKLL